MEYEVAERKEEEEIGMKREEEEVWVCFGCGELIFVCGWITIDLHMRLADWN